VIEVQLAAHGSFSGTEKMLNLDAFLG
jgi:hypothetical protein